MATASATQDSKLTTGKKPSGSGLVRFAWGVVGYNVLVILWGAVVRATGSGAGCGNHWPLCNGVVIPISPTVHTVIEFVHRQMVTGSVLAMIALLVWTLRANVKGRAARMFAVASTVLLVNEAFLGALLVKLGYVEGNQSIGRVILLSIHLSNTLLLIAALTLTSVTLRNGRLWVEFGGPRVRSWGPVLMGLAATLLVGVSGSLAALGDTLFPAASLAEAMAQDLAATSPWLLRVRWVHPVSAVIAALFVVWIVGRAGWARSRWVVGLLAFQFILGVADMLLLAPTWMQVIHLLGADVYWVALVVLAAEVLWLPITRPAAHEATYL